MFENIFKFVFSLFAIGFVMFTTFITQGNACGLQISIFEYNTNQQKISVKDIDLILTNSKTKEKIKFNNSPSIAMFDNLSSGKYRIETNREGYKRRVKDFELDCNFVGENNVFSEYVNLWKIKARDDSQSISQKSALQADIQTKTETEKVETKPSETNKQIEGDSPKTSHKVNIKVTIDEDGNVISAETLDDNSSFAVKAVKAVRQAKFAPTILGGVPIKITGNIVYNFVQ